MGLYLTMMVGGVACALPVGGVREVVEAVPVSRVPGSPDGLLGLFFQRGVPVCVSSASHRLGLGDAGKEGLFVVLASGAEALAVSSVGSVVSGEEEPCPLSGVGAVRLDGGGLAFLIGGP